MRAGSGQQRSIPSCGRTVKAITNPIPTARRSRARHKSLYNLRYRLIPYLYSLHELAHRTGMPVIRPVHLQEPQDLAGVRIDDQFFVGDNILVAPLFNDDGDRNSICPKARGTTSSANSGRFEAA